MNTHNPACFILASGRGGHAENLATLSLERGFDFRGLVSDRASAPVLARMQRLEVPHWCVPFPDSQQGTLAERRRNHEAQVLQIVRGHSAGAGKIWIFLAGYKRLLSGQFLRAFFDPDLKMCRVVNVHPSLLPRFPGLNAYAQAHRAGVTESGHTIHFVDEGMDTGPMISQEKFQVPPQCSLAEFEARGLALEYRAYAQVFESIMSGRFHWKGGS